MHFDEQDDGPFRIYAGALDTPGGPGFVAAVVISRRAAGANVEVWREFDIGGGRRWPRAVDAVAFAFARAQEVIRSRALRVAA
jgi:hypothetical protein